MLYELTKEVEIMKDLGVLVGNDTFTSNTHGKWFDDGKTFVQYYANEVRKCTDVSEITGDELTALLQSNGWENDGTKFYFSPAVYSYSREDWEAMYDGKTDENKDDIYAICDEIANM